MTRTRKAVVVGVDGSEASRVALRRAVEEAHLRGATLEVVHAVGWDAPDTAFSFADRPTVAAGAAHLIDDLLAEELPARDRVGIVTMVREGHAARRPRRAVRRRLAARRGLTRPRRPGKRHARLGEPALHDPRPLPGARRAARTDAGAREGLGLSRPPMTR